MAKINGTIDSCKLCENEFAYEWNFNLHTETILRSPCFGKLCKELSDCYLELKVNYKYENLLVGFSLKGCNVKYAISSAQLKNKRIVQKSTDFYQPHHYRCDIKSYVVLPEFLIPLPFACLRSNYYFVIVVKLQKYFPTSPTPSLLPSENNNSNKTYPALFTEESRNTSYADNPEELIQDLRSLYISGSMHDLEIHIGEDILQTHKLILCARSPVLKKMMEHNCLESISNSIIINDCSTPVFKMFLKYLYTGEIENRKMETVISLYSLSDKYDIPALRKACFKIIQSTFSSESVEVVADFVSDVLQLAECHSDMELKELAVNFIVKHFPLVSNKQSWKDLMRRDFELTSEVLSLVVTACQKMPIHSSYKANIFPNDQYFIYQMQGKKFP